MLMMSIISTLRRDASALLRPHSKRFNKARVANDAVNDDNDDEAAVVGLPKIDPGY